MVKTSKQNQLEATSELGNDCYCNVILLFTYMILLCFSSHPLRDRTSIGGLKSPHGALS